MTICHSIPLSSHKQDYFVLHCQDKRSLDSKFYLVEPENQSVLLVGILPRLVVNAFDANLWQYHGDTAILQMVLGSDYEFVLVRFKLQWSANGIKVDQVENVISFSKNTIYEYRDV